MILRFGLARAEVAQRNPLPRNGPPLGVEFREQRAASQHSGECATVGVCTGYAPGCWGNRVSSLSEDITSGFTAGSPPGGQ